MHTKRLRARGSAVRATLLGGLLAVSPLGACSSSNLMQEAGGAAGRGEAGTSGRAQETQAGRAGLSDSSDGGRAGQTTLPEAGESGVTEGIAGSGGIAGMGMSGSGRGGTNAAGTSGVLISAGTSGSGVSGAGSGSGGSSGRGGTGGAAGSSGASGSSGAGRGGGGSAGSGGTGGSSNGGNAGSAANCGNQVLDTGELCDAPFSANECGSDCKAITSSACTTCEQLPTSLCSDYLHCDLVVGTAAPGSPAAGIKRANLCNEVLDCVRDSGCANDGNAPIKCYCGTAVAADCQAGLGNGKCKAALERGLETTTFATIAQRIGNVTFGGGLAMARVDCDQTFCIEECF